MAENDEFTGVPDRFDPTRTNAPRPVIRARITPTAGAHPIARRTVSSAANRDVDFVPSPAGTARKRTRLRGVTKVAMVGAAGALVATMALPAYAFSPDADANSQYAVSQADALRQGQAQSISVAGGVVQATISRDAFSAEAAPVPTVEPAPVETVAEDTSDTAADRAATSEEFNSYEGDSAAEIAASAPTTSYSLSAVFDTALQYQGVPYVFGGADPSGFDCSGFVMYVFAQYGISMPHSAAGQGAMGTVIPESEAQPGDLVIMDGHDGFYAGNGNILHAPYEGASVRVQPLWTSDYYIVRISG